MNRTVEMYGKVDGVANCVGSIVLKSAHTTSDDEFNKTIQLNLNSCFYILR
jgi:3-oxoacyl-[acyl-carrier protein] reductase